MAEPFKLELVKGYDFFEASSMFQKSIRRGLEREALHFGVAFYESKYDEYLWKRMLIISAEDIGLADPQVHTQIRELYESYSWMKAKKDKKKSQRMFYVQAILILVRAKKSRVVDWALNYAWDAFHSEKLEIQDWALDIHTRRGKMMGKTINDFFDEGSHMENAVVIGNENDYKDWCRKWWNALRGQMPDGTKNPEIDVEKVKVFMGKQKSTTFKKPKDNSQTLF